MQEVRKRRPNTGLTLSMKSYLSSHQLWAAQHFARLAVEQETGRGLGFDLQHRAYVMGALSSSVMFLESLINEVLQDATDYMSFVARAMNAPDEKTRDEIWASNPDREGYLSQVDLKILLDWSKIWTDSNGGYAKMEKKYQSALRSAGASEFNTAADPLQSARLVVAIRNQITHYRPEWTSVADEWTQFETVVKDKFPPTAHMITNPWWPDGCLSAGCATWCVTSAKAFADEFCARVSIRPNFQLVVWKQTP